MGPPAVPVWRSPSVRRPCRRVPGLISPTSRRPCRPPLPARSAARYTPATVTTRPLGGHQDTVGRRRGIPVV
jgi:hypothetical protein